MQLKTSYFSKTLFIKNIARFWPVWAVYLLIWLFAMPVNLGNLLTAPSLTSQGSNFVESIITSQVYRRGFETGSIMTAVFGILAAMAVFSYLYVNKSACMYHALPVKREGLFLSNYLSGLLCIVIPNVIVFVISAIVMSACGYVDLGVLWTWLGLVSAMSVFFYSFGVFCAMITGNILALPVFYGILNFIVVGIEVLAKMVLSTFVFGMNADRGIALGVLSPFYEINAMTTVLNEKIVCWNVIIGYAIAGFVFAVLALLIYKRRQVETAGDVIALRPVKPIFKYGAAFSAALLFGFILYELIGQGSDENAMWRILACMLPAGFVGYYAAEMLLKKSFHVIKKGLLGWLVFSGVLIVLIMAMKLDVFGYERTVPDASNVNQAVIGQYVNLSSNGTFVVDSNNDDVITEDADKIQEIINLHKSIIENKTMIEKFEYSNSTNDGTYSPNKTGVSIYYMMKDGSTLCRSYSIPVTEELLSDAGTPAAAFQTFLNEPDNILNRSFRSDLHKEDFENGYVDVGYSAITMPGDTPSVQPYTNVTLNQDMSYQLYLAILEDIEAGNIGKTYLFHDNEYYNTVYTYTITLQFNNGIASTNSYGATRYISDSARFHIEKNSVNTIAALRSLGLLDDSQLISAGEPNRYNMG